MRSGQSKAPAEIQSSQRRGSALESIQTLFTFLFWYIV